MSSPNVIWKMQPCLLKKKKIALTSVLSGNRKRKDPSRCVVCDSMEPSEGLSVKDGGTLGSCRTCVLSAQIKCGFLVRSSRVVLAKFKVSTKILGLLSSWGKLSQKSFYVHNFWVFFQNWMDASRLFSGNNP